jgi:outer membrane protein assembly factor BamB
MTHQLLLVSCGLLLLSGCDLFTQPPPSVPQAVVVTSDGLVRLLTGDDESVETSWTRDVAASNVAGIVAGSQSLTVASGTGVHQFRVDDGESDWASLELSSDILRVVGGEDEQAFVLGFNELTALSTSTGAVVWTRSLLDDLLGVSDSAIATSSSVLALGGNPNRLLNTANGATLVEEVVLQGDVSQVAFDGAQLLVADTRGLHAIDADDLGTIWDYNDPGAVGVDRFVIGSDGILVSVLGFGLTLIDSTTGEAVGTAEEGEAFRDVVSWSGGFLAARSDGVLIAFDTSLGEVWRVTGAPDFGGLSVGDRNVYYSTGGQLEALSTEAGDYLWSRDFGESVVGLRAL